MNTQKKVFEIIKELGALEHVNEDMSLTEDVGLDSMGMVMLLVSIEDEFDISLSQSDMDPFALETVGDAIDLAEKYIKEGD